MALAAFVLLTAALIGADGHASWKPQPVAVGLGSQPSGKEATDVVAIRQDAGVADSSVDEDAGGTDPGVTPQLPQLACESVLEQTYGALRGWSPSSSQLQLMCVSLLVGPLQLVRNRATAEQPCGTLAVALVQQRAAAGSGTMLPKLPLLKARMCGSSATPAHADLEQSSLHAVETDSFGSSAAVSKAFAFSGSAASFGLQAASQHKRLRHKAKATAQQSRTRKKHKPKPATALPANRRVDVAAALRAREALLAEASAAVSSQTPPPSESLDHSASKSHDHSEKFKEQQKKALMLAEKAQGHASGSVLLQPVHYLWNNVIDALEFICNDKCGLRKRPRAAVVIN